MPKKQQQKKQQQQPKQQIQVAVVAKRPPAQKPKPKAKQAQPSAKGVAVSYAKALPSSVGRYSKLTNSQTVTGSDYLSDVTITGASGTAVLSSFKVNPLTMLPSSRLSGFARLYEKFTVTSMKVIYEPQVSSATSGQVMVWYEANPEITWAQTGQTLLQEVSPMQCRLMTPPWVAGTMTVPDRVLKNAKGGRWFVNPTSAQDPIDVYAGRIYIGVDNLNSGGPALTFGRFILQWTVQFFDAQNSTQTSEAFYLGGSTGGTSTDANPLGTGYTSTGGDPNLVTITGNGTDNVVAVSTPGTYAIDAFTTGGGGAALTSTSTIVYTDINNTSTVIYQGNAGTQKFWRFNFTALVAGASFTIHDAGGTTHPSGAVFVMAVRYSDLALTKSQMREVVHDHRMAQLEARLRALDTWSSSTTITGTITDGNNPTKTVALTSETEYTGIVPVEIIPPPQQTSTSPCSCTSHS